MPGTGQTILQAHLILALLSAAIGCGGSPSGPTAGPPHVASEPPAQGSERSTIGGEPGGDSRLLNEGRAQSSVAVTDLLGLAADWNGSQSGDTQGVSSVRFSEEGFLDVDCRLSGRSTDRAHAEVYVDLQYVLAFEGISPIDLSSRTVTVAAQVPADWRFKGDSPFGLQVFVRDTQGRTQYGAWQNLFPGTDVTARLSPSRRGEGAGYTGDGFDPTACRMIGLKLGSGADFAGRAEGPLLVKRFEISPAIQSRVDPPLPPEPPLSSVSSGWRFDVRPDGLYVEGTKVFLVGGNWRIIDYGQNFGTTAWYPKGNGISKHPRFVEASLKRFRRAGIQVLRIGLLEDGRSMFSPTGEVTGFNEVFRNDLDTLLELARKHHVLIEFVLVDFHLAGKGSSERGVWLRGRSRLISDANMRERFRQSFLVPFLELAGNHDAFFGIDVINEPEWIVSRDEGGAWESVSDETRAAEPIPVAGLRDFIEGCSDLIHELAPGKLVTVGTSCVHVDLVSGIKSLDYLAPHYYPWMGAMEDKLRLMPTGIPFVLEEFPGAGDASLYLERAREANAAGALVWNLTPGIDEYAPPYREFVGLLSDFRRFADELR